MALSSERFENTHSGHCGVESVNGMRFFSLSFTSSYQLMKRWFYGQLQKYRYEYYKRELPDSDFRAKAKKEEQLLFIRVLALQCSDRVDQKSHGISAVGEGRVIVA